jgi:hypothetical protein
LARSCVVATAVLHLHVPVWEESSGVHMSNMSDGPLLCHALRVAGADEFCSVLLEGALVP